ncbi:unannotated protein [freshwater metagenome]|uniref:Unannotated protein n=1 Tax=freshwater metagenome TaxID=449393 RepID=A0A6J6NKS2_9ZZZZ|nr:DUF2017 family protein [Actinomycetota bacterium]MSY52413.1 DUF2017 family protein [Actinomycetota bacterium]MSY88156.1 DUF2017 family protein [Actinomycetota bacterium]MTA51238.1 DUF2017 family protein [Actinomycetota bacterium]
MKIKKDSAGIKLELLEGERDILTQLIDDFREFVMSEDNTDPAVARLFPSAYKESEESAEFRKYSEPALRETKERDSALIRAALERGNAIQISDSEIDSWLRGLNDLRLTLGTRLEVTGDEYGGEIPDDDPRSFLYSLYGWLGWLQGSLLEVEF